MEAEMVEPRHRQSDSEAEFELVRLRRAVDNCEAHQSDTQQIRDDMAKIRIDMDEVKDLAKDVVAGVNRVADLGDRIIPKTIRGWVCGVVGLLVFLLGPNITGLIFILFILDKADQLMMLANKIH